MVKPKAGTEIRESGDSFALGRAATAGATRLEREGGCSIFLSVTQSRTLPYLPNSKNHTAPAASSFSPPKIPVLSRTVEDVYSLPGLVLT
jgi:hypothetical protein